MGLVSVECAQDTHVVAESLIGKSIEKPFDGIIFDGTIMSYTRPYYRVLYSDGDSEDMTTEEVLSYITHPNLVGLRLVRAFQDCGNYVGIIRQYIPKDKAFSILYGDGDTEGVTYDQLLLILLTKPDLKRKRTNEVPPRFQHDHIEVPEIGGVAIQTIILRSQSAVPKRSFFEQMFAMRTLSVQQCANNTAMQPSISFAQYGYEYELISAKLVEEGKNFRGITTKSLHCIYIAVSGGYCPPLCLQDALEGVADFASLPSAGKVASRLELLQSTAVSDVLPQWYNISDIELIDEPISEITSDYMAEGCGFIGCDMLDELVNSACLAVQVRIFGPRIGIFKGMLCRKPGIRKIQLPLSMRKVPPSVTNTEDWVCVVVIRTNPSRTCTELLRYFEGEEIRPSFRPKILSSMVCRLLTTLGVPPCIVNQHKAARIPAHSWLVGPC